MKKSPSTPATKASYHHGDLRRSLLNATLGLVNAQGVQGFTLREAARAAGVSHNAPYRHFSSRADLLVALAIEGQQHLLESLRNSLRTSDDEEERLIRLGVAYMDFATSQTAYFRVMFSGEVVRHSTPELKAAQNATFTYFESRIVAAVEAGLVREDDVRTHALVGWSALHGAAHLVVDGVLARTALAGRRSPRRIARTVLESLLTGIRRNDERT